jgi:hypothetical protein
MPPDLYQTLQLCLAFANGLQVLKWVVKDNLEGNIMQELYQTIPINIMHNQANYNY